MEDSALAAEKMSRDEQPEPAIEGKGSKMCCGCCPSCIPQGSVGLLENNGVYVKTVQPGCLCLCCPFESLRHMDLRLRTLECQSDTKTKDNVTVTVCTSIQFKVDVTRVTLAAYVARRRARWPLGGAPPTTPPPAPTARPRAPHS